MGRDETFRERLRKTNPDLLDDIPTFDDLTPITNLSLVGDRLAVLSHSVMKLASKIDRVDGKMRNIELTIIKLDERIDETHCKREDVIAALLDQSRQQGKALQDLLIRDAVQSEQIQKADLSDREKGRKWWTMWLTIFSTIFSILVLFGGGVWKAGQMDSRLSNHEERIGALWTASANTGDRMGDLKTLVQRDNTTIEHHSSRLTMLEDTVERIRSESRSVLGKADQTRTRSTRSSSFSGSSLP